MIQETNEAPTFVLQSVILPFEETAPMIGSGSLREVS